MSYEDILSEWEQALSKAMDYGEPEKPLPSDSQTYTPSDMGYETENTGAESWTSLTVPAYAIESTEAPTAEDTWEESSEVEEPWQPPEIETPQQETPKTPFANMLDMLRPVTDPLSQLGETVQDVIDMPARWKEGDQPDWWRNFEQSVAETLQPALESEAGQTALQALDWYQQNVVEPAAGLVVRYGNLLPGRQGELVKQIQAGEYKTPTLEDLTLENVQKLLEELREEYRAWEEPVPGAKFALESAVDITNLIPVEKPFVEAAKLSGRALKAGAQSAARATGEYLAEKALQSTPGFVSWDSPMREAGEATARAASDLPSSPLAEGKASELSAAVPREQGSMFDLQEYEAPMSDIAKRQAELTDQLEPQRTAMPASMLNADPERFQYKANTDKQGAGPTLKSVEAWNPELGAGIMAWVDPADGKVWVVNGHNRLALAQRLGVETLPDVRLIKVPTAEEARAIGALKNIAEGRGSAIDAAKFFRDTNLSADDLAQQGIPMREKMVNDGMALSQLEPNVFVRIAQESTPSAIERGVMIGSRLPDHQQQLLADKMLRDYGDELTNKAASEVIDLVANAQTRAAEAGMQGSLFDMGDQAMSMAIQKAKVQAAVKTMLGREKRVFGVAGRYADELSRVGNIESDEALGISKAASQNMALFDAVKNYKNEVGDILDEGAERVAQGEKPNRVAEDIYGRITEALQRVNPEPKGQGATGIQETIATRPAGAAVATAMAEQGSDLGSVAPTVSEVTPAPRLNDGVQPTAAELEAAGTSPAPEPQQLANATSPEPTVSTIGETAAKTETPTVPIEPVAETRFAESAPSTTPLAESQTGVDLTQTPVAPTAQAAAETAPRYTAQQFRADLDSLVGRTAVSTEQIDAYYAMAEALARAAGGTLDDYLGKRLAKVQFGGTPAPNALAQLRDADSPMIRAAKREFGTTKDLREAGYITPDGDLLDFSGNGSKGMGVRHLSHLSIRAVTDDQGLLAVHEFLSHTGAIRVNYSPELREVGIELTQAPTTAQRRAIMSAVDGDLRRVVIDVVDPEVGIPFHQIVTDVPTTSGIGMALNDATRALDEAPSRMLAQADKSALKGAFEVLADGRAIIRMFEAGDASTLVHETAHLLRQNLKGDDLATVEKWAKVVDGKWTTAADEKFARAFERYLAEGKAPIPQLDKIFAQFKTWLIGIYNQITGSAIDVSLSPDIHRLFDNLLSFSDEDMAATGKPYTARQFRNDIIAKGGQSEEVADATMAIVEAHARTLGETVDEYVAKRIAGVQEGEPGENALLQALRAAPDPEELYKVADTSRPQLAALFKQVGRGTGWEPGTVNLDVGGGKFNFAVNFLRKHKVLNVVIDAYNRTQEYNNRSIARLLERPADTATIANVLNVISRADERANLIKGLTEYVRPGGRLYFSVYAAPKVGATKAGTWQEGRKLSTYLSEIQAYYPDAHIVGGEGGYIEATVPGTSVRLPAVDISKEEVVPDIPPEALKKTSQHQSAKGGPRRIGKDIGGALYVHKSYENRIPADILAKAKAELPEDWDYQIVKYERKTGNISFIKSPDWDTSPEPIVGDGYLVRANGETKIVKAPADPWIYHHKWQFVGDDYTGFNVAESKARSALWQALPDVDKRRIGKLSFWQNNVLNRLESGEGAALAQRLGKNGDILGAVTFIEDGRALVYATRANKSTFLHEMAHIFRRDLTGNDLSTIEMWADVTDGQWTRTAEEKFARAFERYLAEGVAPSAALANVFERFKGWMLEIYKRITGTPIGVKLSDDVRQVFDRMLATEDELAAHVRPTGAPGPQGLDAAARRGATQAGANAPAEGTQAALRQTQTTATPPTPPASTTTSTAVSRPEAKLPRSLAGAKYYYGYAEGGNHRNFAVKFESDIDKALYVIGNKGRSRGHERFMEFLREQFPTLSDNAIVKMGKELRDSVIKPLAKSALRDPNAKELTVPAQPRAVQNPLPNITPSSTQSAPPPPTNVGAPSPSNQGPPPPTHTGLTQTPSGSGGPPSLPHTTPLGNQGPPPGNTPPGNVPPGNTPPPGNVPPSNTPPGNTPPGNVPPGPPPNPNVNPQPGPQPGPNVNPQQSDLPRILRGLRDNDIVLPESVWVKLERAWRWVMGELFETHGVPEMAAIQRRVEKYMGRRLTDAENAKLNRLREPGMTGAAAQFIEDGLQPILKKLGEENLPYLSAALIKLDQLNVARAAADPNRMYSWGTRPERLRATLADMRQQIGRERFRDVMKAAKDVQGYVKSLRQLMLDSGLISQSVYDKFVIEFPFYVPTVITDYMDTVGVGGGTGRRALRVDSGVRSLTEEGTEASMQDPLRSLVDATYQIHRAVGRNLTAAAMASVDQLAPNLGLVRELKGNARAKAGEGVFTYLDHGQERKFAVVKEYANAVAMQDNVTVGLAAYMGRILRAPLQAGATGLNILFLPVNMLGDFLTAMVREGITPTQYARALKSVFTNDQIAREFRREGGSMAGFFGSTRAKTTIEDMVAKPWYVVNSAKDLKRLVKDVITLRPVSALGAAIEEVPRTATYAKRKAAGETAVRAGVAARTVSMDFDRGGRFIMLLNKTIPFLNVAFQAPAQVLRTFGEQSNWGAAALRLSGIVVAPVLAFEVWNRNFPEYEDIPEYVRNRSMIIMTPWSGQKKDRFGNPIPEYIQIPLREWAPFAILTKEAIRRWRSENPTAWQKLALGIEQSWSPVQGENAAELAFGFLPPLLTSAIEIGVNRDFYRDRPIIPEDRLHLAAAEQYQPWTSESARLIGKAMGVSPAQLEYFVTANFAGLGKQAIGLSDMLLGAAGQARRKKPTLQAGESLWGWWVPKQGDAQLASNDRLAELRKQAAAGEGSLYVVGGKDEQSAQSKVYASEFLETIGQESVPTQIPILGGLIGTVYGTRGGQRAIAKKEMVDEKLGKGTSEATTRGWQAARSQLDQAKADQQELDVQLETGLISAEEWKQQRKLVQARKSGAVEGIANAFPMAAMTGDRARQYKEAVNQINGQAPNKEERIQMLASAYMALEPPEGVDGQPDWDTYYSARTDFLTQMAPDDRIAVTNYVSKNATPKEKEYLQAQDLMRDYRKLTDSKKKSEFWRANSELLDRFYGQAAKIKGIAGNLTASASSAAMPTAASMGSTTGAAMLASTQYAQYKNELDRQMDGYYNAGSPEVQGLVDTYGAMGTEERTKFRKERPGDYAQINQYYRNRDQMLEKPEYALLATYLKFLDGMGGRENRDIIEEVTGQNTSDMFVQAILRGLITPDIVLGGGKVQSTGGSQGAAAKQSTGSQGSSSKPQSTTGSGTSSSRPGTTTGKTTTSGWAPVRQTGQPRVGATHREVFFTPDGKFIGRSRTTTTQVAATQATTRKAATTSGPRATGPAAVPIPRGRGVDAYDGPDTGWVKQFVREHGRTPTWADYEDRLWSLDFLSRNGRPPTPEEWERRYELNSRQKTIA